ncbi:hypothetical protein [Paraburkholderia dilworthii]|uniref:hypothetical protein n=1 Tax=Paraburkholderia dilworthii TaxID=948106 RepID=UPI00040D033F|nr:hypothetical protein [Paraburkholderia dilworthii]
MSAPENSNSKVPPSLLSDRAKGADGNGSRILANLEGRVAPPTDKPRRSTTPLALVALLVIAAGVWGAWHMQQRTPGEPLAAAVPTGAANVAAAVPASVAAAAVRVAANAQAPASASSQAATIIADDSDSKAAASSTSASAGLAESRLSRALADGAEPSSASAPVASVASVASLAGASGTAPTVAPAGKHDRSSTTVASRSKHDAASRSKKESATTSVSSHHSGTTTAATQATKTKQTKQTKPGATSKDDSDADLLAALVARTKPADKKAGGSTPATRVTTSAVQGNAKLAERVKECGQRGFFEDQLCRWRVCDGHWGKDPACPGSAPQARQP